MSGEVVGPILERFALAWRAGLSPSITEFVGDTTEPDRSAVLRELIAVEVKLRRERGESPIAKDYQATFPGRDVLVGEIFDSLKSTALEGKEASIATRNGLEMGPVGSPPVDSYATLSYVVSGVGGRLRPWMDADKNKQLCDVFRPGGVVDERYRIDRELGRGGMGVVFLGRDLRLDRLVAIKASLLLGRTSDDDEPRLAALRGAFAEEARLGANLTHPAIATVYDYGFHDEKPFTIFEYLPGETLSDLLRRRGRLPLEEVRLIVGSIAQALDFAHARRVVHRDLKPDNIRATEQGLFKVLDLGLAREFGRDVDWSGFAGTPAYASPEQASGLPCDGRADQYALALIAFELLAGHRLFQASGAFEMIAMHREAEPEAIGTDLADAPETVRLALERALSKDPNARFATCSDFAVALGSQLLSVPATAPEILMEADIQSMKVGRRIHWRSFPWLKESVHLALTPDSLWSVYQTEVRRWPLSEIKQIEPRTDPIDDREAGELARDEATRLLHRDSESKVRSIGRAHTFMMLADLLILALLIGLAIIHFASSSILPIVIAATVVAILAAWFFAVSRGLGRLRPWARWAVLSEALLLSVIAVVILIAVSMAPQRSGAPDLVTRLLVTGLFFGTLVAVAFSLAGILFSKKRSILFTASYQAIVKRTPYLNPRSFLHFDSSRGRTLRLSSRLADDPMSPISCRFQTPDETKRWAGRLVGLAKRLVGRSVTETEATPGEPTLVVLLRQRPSARYQLLGTVEAKGSKRRTAEAGLQVRAAILGADSVVDLQEEFLPDFHRSIRRLTGTAVRAVDAEGRFEFRSRWYVDRIGWVGKWALVLLLLSLVLTLLSSVLSNGLEQGRLFMMRGNLPAASANAPEFGSNFSWLVLGSALIVVAIHAWPMGLVALTRALRWPQLVRPLTVALVAFALRPVYLLVGLVSAAVWSGGWSGLLYHSLWLLDPINFSMMVFGLLLGRTAWRADAEFRRLIPDTARKVPPLRAIVGGLALVTSAIYVAILACFVVWNAHTAASLFRLPTPENRQPVSAAALLNSGLTLLRSNPAQAEQKFREALKIWEELARQNPSEIDHQINLEAAWTNLGLAALAQGRVAEGKEQLRRSLARWEELTSRPISAERRLSIDKTLFSIRFVLKSQEVEESITEGTKLMKGGDEAKAEAAYRQAIQSWAAWQESPSTSPAFRTLRIDQEARANSNLAWVIAIDPGRSPEKNREATTMAERAVALSPQKDYCWGTLALVRYRAKDWLGASSAMDHAIELRGGSDATRSSILAMIRFRQGDLAESRRYYDQAISELEKQSPADQAARRLHVEAAALLGISPDRP